MDKNAPIYKSSGHNIAPSGLILYNSSDITTIPVRDPQAEAMCHHRSLFPICPREEAWADCRRSLPPIRGTIHRGYSKGMAAGFLAFSELASSSEEGRKEHLHHRGSALPLLR